MRFALLSFALWSWCAAALAAADRPVILVVGDSLSAAYSMQREEGWPQLMQSRLDEIGLDYAVFNSSIAGETTQGGLARLPRLLERTEPAWVIIELGGNDGLRGIDLGVTRANLERMIELSRAAGAGVVLAGIKLPPNYGPAYTSRFEAIYTDLAKAHGALLVPFILEGVALDPALMMDDGIHPNAAAQPVLLDNVWDVLGPRLAGGEGGEAAARADSAPG
jgi:acyl-CoA thioesterase-1